MKWYFQFTKHDEHDYDATQVPVLLEQDGKHLIAQANRNGFFYVLDRATGKLLSANSYAKVTWSSGKDSAWALHVLRQQPDVDVVGLVTTVNAAFDRVAMHGVRRTLVEAQAEAAGLPLHVLAIPHPCPNAEYERIMGEFVARQASEGIEAMAFGDLFLEDIRRYREAKLAGTGLTPLFPLWGIETTGLARTMIDMSGLVERTRRNPQGDIEIRCVGLRPGESVPGPGVHHR